MAVVKIVELIGSSPLLIKNPQKLTLIGVNKQIDDRSFVRN